MKELWVKRFVISTFVVLYAIVSVISTIHVIDFFELSNPYWLAVSLAIAFEFGAAASLASLVALDKMNKGIVWALFITITAMQMQGNMYYAFKNLQGFTDWVELFGLIEEEPAFQKRILAFVSGAILPLVALGFIKSLVDYIRPSEDATKIIVEKEVMEVAEQITEELEAYEDLRAEETEEVKEVPAAPLYEDKVETPIEKLNDDVIDEILKGEEFFVPQETEDSAPVIETLDDEKVYEAGRELFKNQINSLNKQKAKEEKNQPSGLMDQVNSSKMNITNDKPINPR